MQTLDELRHWVRFDARDEARLRALMPYAEPEFGTITTRFYERVLESEGARRVLEDEAQVSRLMVTLRRWMRELLTGPWDADYAVARERIGRVHVQVGLAPRYLFAAMNIVRSELCRIAHSKLAPEAVEPTCIAIQRITDIDLALITGTYVSASATSQMSSLQDLIVSNMPVTVLLLDADSRISAATRSAARLFGDREVVHLELADALPAALIAAAELTEQVRHATNTHREILLPRVDTRIDGRERVFRINVVPLEHPLARVLLHVEELTETIRTEARLRESESLAQLGALSAAVAHELRNPLAGISGAIQVIARSLPDSDRRKPIMDKVEQQVRRLDALVTDLLAFARPSQAKTERIDLLDACSSIRDLVARDHPEVELVLIGQGEAIADANLLAQVVLNLVLNAVQAVGASGRVEIHLAPGSIVIADNGPGVKEEDLEKIFQPFYTTRARGTGLGLAICRKLLTAMGGRLELLDSGPMRGACFRASLAG